MPQRERVLLSLSFHWYFLPWAPKVLFEVEKPLGMRAVCYQLDTRLVSVPIHGRCAAHNAFCVIPEEELHCQILICCFLHK